MFLHTAQNPAPYCEYCCLFYPAAHCNPYLYCSLCSRPQCPCVWCITALSAEYVWQRLVLLSLVWWNVFREYVSVSIRSLTIWGIWRTLRQREHSILQIMLQYDDVNNQQDATTFLFINLFNSALCVLDHKFTILRSTFWLYKQLLVQCTAMINYP